MTSCLFVPSLLLVFYYLEEIYNDPACQELLDVASFLDPRWKFDYMSIQALGATKARVKTEMEQVAQKVTF